MAISETKKIGGVEFTARRLTVREIRDFLEGSDKQPWSFLDYLFEDHLPEPLLLKSLNVDLAAMDNLEAEEVKDLMEMVAAVNPTLAAAEKRVAARAKSLVSGSTASAPG